MKSKEIRQKFMEFFRDKGHEIVESAPIVVKDDPTLMFTNAGMNQFKDAFLGNSEPEAKRVADTQKCLRVSGKHNDLEEVGHDTYHHTMFEMLGNWSFGDYFKKEAIEWAWELLTGVYKLPADRMYATVFEGDAEDNLGEDEEARKYWLDLLPPERILNGSKKDNFWEMGDSGPCGPCSEIHIDLRPDSEREKKDGASLVNQDHPQVVEIWNLVFMEFNRLADKSLVNLPAKHVDTGMGFERLCMAIQGKNSNYDTDVFTPLINKITLLAGVEYGETEKSDIAIRVIADHVRAVAFAVSDGQIPSNTGAGYVIRRILRRAVRYGFTFLDQNKPLIYKLIPVLTEQFGEVFPTVKHQQDFISRVIEEEENSFLKTLEVGLNRLEIVFKELRKGKNDTVSGKQAFELYDTFGFPVDLTGLIAREQGFNVDIEEFNSELKKQKDRSRADAAKETGDWITLNTKPVSFIGYEHLVGETTIARYRKMKVKGKERFEIVLNESPFYAESGGQVGDTGLLIQGDDKVRVLDTVKENELNVVITEKLPENKEGKLKAVVESQKRDLTACNHSATHLMHAALRQVLGTHVEQRGSLVNDKLLRFDFSHFSKMTPEEIREVEKIVNAKIRENIDLDEQRDIPIEKAKEMGAMALFGEKYGDKVRVITFDKNYSVELCGGTHVRSTGQIGLFKIISESSVAAGIRRIEAITAVEAEKFVQNQEMIIEEVKGMLKSPRDITTAVKNLIDAKNTLEKEIEKLKNQGAKGLRDDLLKGAVSKDGAEFIVEQVDAHDASVLKNIAFEIRKSGRNMGMVLGAVINEKPIITIMISGKLEESFNASEIVGEISREIKGGGGGQPFFATAGGSDPAGMEKALDKARKIFGL